MAPLLAAPPLLGLRPSFRASAWRERRFHPQLPPRRHVDGQGRDGLAERPHDRWGLGVWGLGLGVGVRDDGLRVRGERGTHVPGRQAPHRLSQCAADSALSLQLHPQNRRGWRRASRHLRKRKAGCRSREREAGRCLRATGATVQDRKRLGRRAGATAPRPLLQQRTARGQARRMWISGRSLPRSGGQRAGPRGCWAL
jgi:hypothetical protein